MSDKTPTTVPNYRYASHSLCVHLRTMLEFWPGRMATGGRDRIEPYLDYSL